jgi:hypothetical protein
MSRDHLPRLKRGKRGDWRIVACTCGQPLDGPDPDDTFAWHVAASRNGVAFEIVKAMAGVRR